MRLSAQIGNLHHGLVQPGDDARQQRAKQELSGIQQGEPLDSWQGYHPAIAQRPSSMSANFSAMAASLIRTPFLDSRRLDTLPRLSRRDLHHYQAAAAAVLMPAQIAARSGASAAAMVVMVVLIIVHRRAPVCLQRLPGPRPIALNDLQCRLRIPWITVNTALMLPEIAAQTVVKTA